MCKTYFCVTEAEHLKYVEVLSAEGYRPISLCVYGDPTDARYAAVWVQRPGPAWSTVSGVDAAGYQAFFDEWTGKGYSPALISATGRSAEAIFSGVFEQNGMKEWMSRSGMTVDSFASFNESARQSRQILKSVTVYGTPDDCRYAAVWHANPDFTKWHVVLAGASSDYQTAFNAQTQLPGLEPQAWRPALVSLSSDQLYCSVFKSDWGGPWFARHDMNAASYAAELEKMTALGFYPIELQAGGSGPYARYAAVFAKQDQPSPRAWTATGPSTPALLELDELMRLFMRVNGVRAAQLAVGKGGECLMSRAYTWAEAGYRTTLPSDRFLLASCSKAFLEAAVQSLYDTGALTPDALVYPLLGFSNPADPRSDAITIQQLLDHRGGYDDRPTTEGGSGFDPSYSLREIARTLGLSQPANRLDAARYMYARPLQFTPGEGPQYSNFGYMLAGAVVEQVAGMDYFAYLKQAVLDVDGIQEVEVFATTPDQRRPWDAIAEDEAMGCSVLALDSTLQVPAVYGGSGCINEVCAPNAGLGASAQALMQFVHRHAVWGNGPRAAGMSRSGSTYGASTWASSRTDGLDWALTINTRNWAPCSRDVMVDLTTAIEAVLDGPEATMENRSATLSRRP